VGIVLREQDLHAWSERLPELATVPPPPVPKRDLDSGKRAVAEVKPLLPERLASNPRVDL